MHPIEYTDAFREDIVQFMLNHYLESNNITISNLSLYELRNIKRAFVIGCAQMLVVQDIVFNKMEDEEKCQDWIAFFAKKVAEYLINEQHNQN